MVLHALTLSLPDCLNLRESDTVLAVVPMFHVNAWGLPFACAMLGSNQVLPGPCLDAASLVELFETERVTLTAGVPTIWHGVLNYLDEHPGHDLSSIRAMIVGGAAIPESTLRAFDARHGLHLVHAWGMTETSPIGSISHVPSELASAPPDDSRVAGDARAPGPDGGDPRTKRRRARRLGRRDDGRARGPRAVGRLGVLPGDVAEDRWTDDGWFRTGDIVTIAPRGCVTIQDRAKDLVKSGGEWISTVALESVLVGHAAVSEVVVVAVPHPQWGERPLAVIVPATGCQPTIEELRAYLAPHFAKWWLPDAVVCVERLPKTATGKSRKHEVRAMFREHLSNAASGA